MNHNKLLLLSLFQLFVTQDQIEKSQLILNRYTIPQKNIYEKSICIEYEQDDEIIFLRDTANETGLSLENEGTDGPPLCSFVIFYNYFSDFPPKIIIFLSLGLSIILRYK